MRARLWRSRTYLFSPASSRLGSTTRIRASSPVERPCGSAPYTTKATTTGHTQINACNGEGRTFPRRHGHGAHAPRLAVRRNRISTYSFIGVRSRSRVYRRQGRAPVIPAVWQTRRGRSDRAEGYRPLGYETVSSPSGFAESGPCVRFEESPSSLWGPSSVLPRSRCPCGRSLGFSTLDSLIAGSLHQYCVNCNIPQTLSGPPVFDDVFVHRQGFWLPRLDSPGLCQYLGSDCDGHGGRFRVITNTLRLVNIWGQIDGECTRLT